MNLAQEILLPKESGIFRTVFLYVGQGDATLMVIPDGSEYKVVLIDSHLDEKSGGINLPDLLSDLIDEDSQGILYINTHPHNDHLGGIEKIKESVDISEVWHSGHKPGGDHAEVFEELSALIEELDPSNVVQLEGTKDEQLIGDVTYNILAPAEYVVDEIADEKPDDRASRIHEQCAVIRFSYGEDPKQILITGDADLDAWKNHITYYHTERLPSVILSAPHHGSRSFFVKDEGDEPYCDHIKAINPQYVVVSAPKSSESPHDHPHQEALDNYLKVISEENLIHLGENRECFIADIDAQGNLTTFTDEGQLAANYSLEGSENNECKTKPTISIEKFKLGDYSHRLSPLWEVSAAVKSFPISANLHKKKGRGKNIFQRTIQNKSDILFDNYEIEYKAKPDKSIQYDDVRWQVVNTGPHVEQIGNNAKRGDEFFRSRTQNKSLSKNPLITWERTEYTGRHWIECFLLKNDLVVGRSIFLINILNDEFPL